MATTFLVDAHVHYHDCFDAGRFLDGARANFAAGAAELGKSAASCGCLAFTESAWDHKFRSFRDETLPMKPDGWTIDRTSEDCSLLARHADGALLIMLAGRQIVTAEGLEVLAIGTASEFDDGIGTRAAIDAVRASGAIAVMPWGFGKWWFKRGRIAAGIVEGLDGDAFYLGDNGGRPNLSRRPPLFARGRRRGIRVLPGSDPLPFASQSSAVGSYGFAVAGEFNIERPGASVRQAILSHAGDYECFGRGENLLRFCRQQVAMQVVKRRRRA